MKTWIEMSAISFSFQADGGRVILACSVYLTHTNREITKNKLFYIKSPQTSVTYVTYPSIASLR